MIASSRVFPASAQVGGGVSVVQPSATATYPITVDAMKTLVDAGSGPLMLSRAKTGHVDKCEVVVIIPANQRTKLFVGADLNLTGCAIDATTREVTSFDETLETWVAIACRGSSLVASFRQVVAAEAVASTILSATVNVDGDPTVLTVVRSEPTDSQSLTGLSLTGVSQTLTGISSVDGATTVYDLSAPFVGSEAGNIVVGAGRTDRDLNGNLVAAETVPLTVRNGLVSIATWVESWEAKKGLVPPTSGDVVTWTGQQAGKVLVPGAAGHAQSAVAGVAFSASTQYLKVLASTVSASNGDFAIYVRMKQTSDGALDVGVDWSDGSTNHHLWIGLAAGSAQVEIADGTLTTAPLVSLVTGATYHDIFLERVGSTLTLTVDALAPATSTNASNLADVSPLTVLSVGAALIPSEYLPLAGAVACVAYGVSLTSDEKAAIRAYAATNYP